MNKYRMPLGNLLLRTGVLKSLFLLLLLFIFNIIYAQSQTNDIFNTRSSIQKNSNDLTWWKVYIKPISLVDFETGTIQIGTERKINNHFAVSFDYGLKFSALSIGAKNDTRKDYHYSKSNIEIKYFTGTERSNIRNGLHYFSLRGFYFPQTYRLNDEFLYLDSSSYHYDYSNVKRTTWTLTFISGHQFIKNRWMYNPYLCVGIRSITIQHHPYDLSPGSPTNPIDWDFSSHIDRKQGTFYRPNFVFGITMGYLIGK